MADAAVEFLVEKNRTDSYDSDDYEDDDHEDEGIGRHKEVEQPVKEQNVVVGIHYEIGRLLKDVIGKYSFELRVLSIVGMAGLGKTILAQEIFHDDDILYHFPIRIWVYVSKAFSAKEVFLHILKEFTLLTEDIKTKTEKELAELVVGFLENERFLLVLDDLWSPVDWDRLKVALPMSNDKGRVLITSRSMEVGSYVNSFMGPYRMRPLSEDESFHWKLYVGKSSLQSCNV